MYIYCSAKIALKHDIAIEVDKGSDDKRRAGSPKGLENMLMLFSV